MTGLEIAGILFLKGVVIVALEKFGLWPDWEKRALRRDEHKRVIKEYEEWCAKTGERPALDHKLWNKMLERRGVKVEKRL